MPEGSLRIIVTDLVDDPVEGDVTVDLTPAEGGSHSVRWTGEFALSGGAVVAELEDIPCQGGFGTTYRVSVKTGNFRRFQFLQRIGSSHKCMHDSGMISPITRRPKDEE